MQLQKEVSLQNITGEYCLFFCFFLTGHNKIYALLTKSHSRKFRGHTVIMPLNDQLSVFLIGSADQSPGLLQI